ncbi:unnamed protein product [Lasius platythorax]|uniref:Uncharacterized protein n=1 Tax=Lasius platythorax TaxID=488582 RepID=A0AAV2N251_9HYME
MQLRIFFESESKEFCPPREISEVYKHGEMFGGSGLSRCGREAVKSKLFTFESFRRNWERIVSLYTRHVTGSNVSRTVHT